MRQRFVLEYLADGQRNATQAALRAGYRPSCARSEASKMLHDDEIQQAISDQLAKHLVKLQVNAEMVISGIVESIDSAKRAGQGAWQMQAIQRGYELLGRYLGIFTDKIEVGVDDKIVQELERGRLRAAGLLPAEQQNDATDSLEESKAEDEPKPN
jgi:hypothetical protein